MNARDFTLAALAAGYPSDDLREVLCELRGELEGHVALGPLVRRLDEGLQEVQGDYVACFEAGSARAPLYETEYGRMRGLSKGKDLADVVGFYSAFGLTLGEAPEMPDHVAVELEFYALLLHKQEVLASDPEGTEIVLDARRKFLADHLGGFVGALAQRPSVVASAVYGPLFAWVAGLVAAECTRLGVRPAPLDFFAAEDGEMNCGGCVSLPSPKDRACPA